MLLQFIQKNTFKMGGRVFLFFFGALPGGPWTDNFLNECSYYTIKYIQRGSHVEKFLGEPFRGGSRDRHYFYVCSYYTIKYIHNGSHAFSTSPSGGGGGGAGEKVFKRVFILYHKINIKLKP